MCKKPLQPPDAPQFLHLGGDPALRDLGGGTLDLSLECNWLRAIVPVEPALDSRGKK